MQRSHGAWLGAGWWGWHLGLSLLLAAGLLHDTWGGELQRFEATQPLMGVPFKIILYAPGEAAAKGAFDAAFARIAQLDSILSDYDPNSELSRLSRSSGTGQTLPLSPDLWQVLERSQQLAVSTQGAFDVTVGPYVRLWRRARRNKQMPSPQRMAEAQAAVGYPLVQLDAEQHAARLNQPNMRLDLGGIAMGYAVDEALKVLHDHGVSRALVNASGDIGVSDPPPGKCGWTIDVAPANQTGAPSATIRLANAAVTTAGDAFQHVVIDGRRYSHIVDPRTGLGLVDQIAVAVVARDCMTADSLDTAVSVLGTSAGLQLIERTPGAAALIVEPAGKQPKIFESKNFHAFVVDTP